MKQGWKSAFIGQAESDFSLFRMLHDQKQVEPCHYLHYLQMASEKIAKGLTLPDETTKPQEVHLALARWLRTAKSSPHKHLMNLCKIKRVQHFRAYLERLVAFAETIESLAPAVAKQRGGGPNAEYPWMDVRTSEVKAPANYRFPEILQNPKYIKLLEFIDASIRFGRSTLK